MTNVISSIAVMIDVVREVSGLGGCRLLLFRGCVPHWFAVTQRTLAGAGISDYAGSSHWNTGGLRCPRVVTASNN